MAILNKRYLQATKEYRQSTRCSADLRHCADEIKANPSRLYIILNELKSVFKSNQQSTRQENGDTNDKSKPDSPLVIKSVESLAAKSTDDSKDGVNNSNGGTDACSSSTTTSQLPDSSTATAVDNTTLNESLSVDEKGDTPSCSAHPRRVDLVSCPLPSSTTTGVSSQPSSSSSTTAVLNVASATSDSPRANGLTPSTSSSSTVKKTKTSSSSSKANIERLESILSRITAKIRQLEQEELDFDSLDSVNSPYMHLDVLKRRYLEAWRRLCDARKVSRISGRILRRRFTYNGCEYEQVNRKIEDLVNIQKEFPDYSDVRQIIDQVNKEQKLNLRSSTVAMLVREVLVDVGYLLKKRRQDDLNHDFGCHLTDDMREEDDPTLSDLQLRRQLIQNRRICEVKMNTVFADYVQLQNSASLGHHHHNNQQQNSNQPDAENSPKEEPSPSPTSSSSSSSDSFVIPDSVEKKVLDNAPSSSRNPPVPPLPPSNNNNSDHPDEDELLVISSDDDDDESVQPGEMTTALALPSSSSPPIESIDISRPTKRRRTVNHQLSASRSSQFATLIQQFHHQHVVLTSSTVSTNSFSVFPDFIPNGYQLPPSPPPPASSFVDPETGCEVIEID